MKSAFVLLLSTLLVHQVLGENQVQPYAPQPSTINVRDLQDNIVSEILTILINGTVQLIKTCMLDDQPSQIKYWLYTRRRPDGQLISLKCTNFKRPTMLLLHGWLGNKDSGYIDAIRNAYLQRYNANVIIVDYGYYADEEYLKAWCKLPMVAQYFATFLCELSKYRSLSDVHLAGHSLGAQLAGLAGQLVQSNCGIIGRITALDPAGPLFQGVGTQHRLDPSDAIFVDAVHTNQGQFGYIGNIGDVDFYANCGTYQPGCWKAFPKNVSRETIIPITVNYISCNHIRSCYYFAESITNNSFYAYSTVSPFICNKDDLMVEDHTYMGEYCRSSQKNKTYNVKTNAESPFGRGPDGPLY